MHDTSTRHCTVCGRTITWRKKWARNWDAVRYCSASCRSRRRSRTDEELEQAILSLLDRGSATICPSEAAKAVSPDDWRSLMEPARMAARRLSNRGLVEFRQAGRSVDPSTARGPIRIALLRTSPHVERVST